MSVEIWPPISLDELKIQEDATQARELAWLLTSLRATLEQLRSGLEDCCALLSPSDSAPSTLALTTPRNETVKGHATRVGTRLVRGLVHLKLRTLPPQTLALDPARPVLVAALGRLENLLAQSVGVCFELAEHDRRPAPPSAPYLAAQLRLLAQHIAEAAALVKGPPNTTAAAANANTTTTTTTTTAGAGAGAGEPQPLPDTAWTTDSTSLGHFAPPLSRNLSVYITIQDAHLVLYVRALEPADAPVNLGTKLALAIGTTRRLEHDEAERVFAYRHDASSRIDPGAGDDEVQAQVYVREKVRVESADPSLLSLSAKLNALGNTLGLARRNLAAVMGEAVDE
ncbi:RAVE subunit 2/Rogdi [Hypoxylon fuscum]|nr:RAVE subunit 2/Rogdi [Hypoxylon fuscum]